MTEDPHKVVDLHPSEWKRSEERWPIFGAGLVPFLVYGIVGVCVVTALRFLADLL